MQAVWFKGHKDKEARRKEVLSYQNAFNELSTILEQNYQKKESVRDYNPGWEYKQIAVNEYNAVLNEILTLLKLNKE